MELRTLGTYLDSTHNRLSSDLKRGNPSIISFLIPKMKLDPSSYSLGTGEIFQNKLNMLSLNSQFFYKTDISRDNFSTRKKFMWKIYLISRNNY